ncbi:unnamed protein product, partial [Mesorhabditis belari]|uniref:SH3 domain-containing protein n=1 Tax=Mesorhabditis belari TaxID=2138241 RepID=A0AAF3E849_9BILA
MELLERIFCCTEAKETYHAHSIAPPRPSKPHFAFTEDPGCKLSNPAIIATTPIGTRPNSSTNLAVIDGDLDERQESYLPVQVNPARPTEFSIENPLFQMSEERKVIDDWTSIELATTPLRYGNQMKTPLHGMPVIHNLATPGGGPFIPVIPRRKTFSHLGDSLETPSTKPVVPARPLSSSLSLSHDLHKVTIAKEKLKQIPGNPPKTPARPPPANRGQISPTNDPYAVVLYPFTGSQFDELSCDAGDKVLLKREVDDQWIYGMNTRTGQHGIMPLSYLDVKVPLVPTQKGANVTTALYDYTTGVDGDLQFRAGDLIDIVEWVDEQWLRGRIGSATGIFPANFVDSQSLTSISKPLRSPMKSSPSKETVTVAYDYNTGMAEDLVCRAGDVVEVVERLDSNWIKGRLRGQTGMIPTTFLQDSSDNRKSMSGFVEREMTVISDYASHEPGHLSVTRGDKVKIVEELDDYWYKGKPLDSVFRFMEPGFIPKHCVQ